jgi:hypothetical protein
MFVNVTLSPQYTNKKKRKKKKKEMLTLLTPSPTWATFSFNKCIPTMGKLSKRSHKREQKSRISCSQTRQQILSLDMDLSTGHWSGRKRQKDVQFSRSARNNTHSGKGTGRKFSVTFHFQHITVGTRHKCSLRTVSRTTSTCFTADQRSVAHQFHSLITGGRGWSLPHHRLFGTHQIRKIETKYLQTWDLQACIPGCTLLGKADDRGTLSFITASG